MTSQVTAVKAVGVEKQKATKAAHPVERRIRNGVREPARGGKCWKIWNRLDKLQERTGQEPTVAQATKFRGVNENNARIEFYNWRRFHRSVKRNRTK